ncbi:MAG: phasin family protein, partial [Pseudolabrys sp.]
TKTAVDFAQRMSGVKSPSEFFQLSTDLAQQQLETLTKQTQQLSALAQQVTLATTEPLKSSFTKASLAPST